MLEYSWLIIWQLHHCQGLSHACTCTNSPPNPPPIRLPHSMEQSSICSTVGPCWLSIWNIAMIPTNFLTLVQLSTSMSQFLYLQNRDSNDNLMELLTDRTRKSVCVYTHLLMSLSACTHTFVSVLMYMNVKKSMSSHHYFQLHSHTTGLFSPSPPVSTTPSSDSESLGGTIPAVLIGFHLHPGVSLVPAIRPVDYSATSREGNQ